MEGEVKRKTAIESKNEERGIRGWEGWAKGKRLRNREPDQRGGGKSYWNKIGKSIKY